jgi:predicted N-acetyltransferase YhbS
MEFERIRPAEVSEAEVLTRLSVEAARTHVGAGADLGSFLAVEPSGIEAGLTFVAESAEGAIVGVMAMRRTGLHGLILLDRLFVAPARHRTGIGRRLFEKAAQTAAAMGAGTIIIYAHPGAVGFYGRIGAISIGATALPIMPGLVLEVMAYAVRRGETPR